MGSILEANFPEAQPRDSSCWPVSSRLSSLHKVLTFYRLLEAKRNGAAIQLIDTLLTELKRLDDKLVLTEVHLLESKVYRNIENLPKSKVSRALDSYSSP